MNLRQHAEKELNILGNDNVFNKHILDIVDIFSKEDHSGSSAAYAINVIENILKFKPASPLTGEDCEWNEVGDGVYQNNRCSSVFKSRDRFDGQAYDINGRVFIDNNGIAYTNTDSFVPITFPYTPRTEYIKTQTSKD